MTPGYLLCYAQYCITPLPGYNEWHHNNCPWSPWSGGAPSCSCSAQSADYCHTQAALSSQPWLGVSR